MSIDTLIINSPYEEPKSYWFYVSETREFERREGRRPAGYIVAAPNSKSLDDPGILKEIELVNQIRPRVKAWREAGYTGVTGITKRLLEHWQDIEAREGRRFFFCQFEAIETLIWLAEAPASEKVGIDIPSDGSSFRRICSKMATGTGKTIVMTMLIAWQVINKATYGNDARFSKNILVIAPGLTVKSRLQVLIPSSEGNYYEEFDVVPQGLHDKLRQGKVHVINWHALNWETDEKLAKKKSVDKRGAMSDEAYARQVLQDMANAKNFLVINDEAHHAWRVPPGQRLTGVSKDDVEEATKWIGGLDRLHKARAILTTYDFSATPFIPSGRKGAEEDLFTWVVSDFGLNDAIESGLVKTPRVVVRDNGKYTKDYKSQFYHLYTVPEVKEAINKKGAKPEESLPDLLTVGYELLGADWRETLRQWKEAEHPIPPVMITVANRTETAARIKYAFDHGRIEIPALCDADKTLHIDSKVLEMAESQDEPVLPLFDDEDGEGEEDGSRKLTKKEEAELLRRKVDTIGQIGKPGEQIQHVISVGMLSEGWDAKTVTHIMGLRAFTSQLLCEQVVGRGLRRTSYEINKGTGLFEAEYVNIFGVPFTFLPHEATEGTPPKPQSSKTRIEAVKDKQQHAIRWPNVLRIEHVFKTNLTLNLETTDPLEISAFDTPRIAELAPVIDGKPDFSKASEIDLVRLDREERLQRSIFNVAVRVFDQMKDQWKGDTNHLFAQLVALVEKFIQSEKLVFSPPMFKLDERLRRILIRLNMNKIVNHVRAAVKQENAESLELVFDSEQPIKSTAAMPIWWTGKKVVRARKSHVNFCVCDSAWEANEAFALDHHPNINAWVKNDHLGFEIKYIYDGADHRYRPDFLIRLKDGSILVLETKGQESQKDRIKRDAMKEWCRAVNEQGGFGVWRNAMSKHPDDITEILAGLD
jgi:type III restriction enzyme